jgi:hypothetical protein
MPGENIESGDSDTEGVLNRRSAMKLLGIGTGSLSLMSGVASAKNEGKRSKAKKEFFKQAKKKYGSKEAKIAEKIVERKIKQGEKQGWDAEKVNAEITEAILKHPHTPASSRDIRDYREAKEAFFAGELTEADSSGGVN